MSNLLVIGLGNPGSEYDKTRHNVGARAVELFGERHNLSFSREKSLKARVAVTTIGDVRVIASIPTTYMNESGEAGAPLVRRYLDDDPSKLDRLVVIHDELDLSPGVVRLKFAGGTAGHNGLKSLGAHLHSFDFARIRIGVGKPPGSMSGAGYVLRRLPKAEQEMFDAACANAADAVEAVAMNGFERAMNTWNTR